jgi:hypothetical protein
MKKGPSPSGGTGMSAAIILLDFVLVNMRRCVNAGTQLLLSGVRRLDALAKLLETVHSPRNPQSGRNSRTVRVQTASVICVTCQAQRRGEAVGNLWTGRPWPLDWLLLFFQFPGSQHEGCERHSSWATRPQSN